MQSVLQGVHAQGHVHARAVGEEGSQSRLNKEAEDQDPVPVEHRVTTNQRQQLRFRQSQKNKKHSSSLTSQLHAAPPSLTSCPAETGSSSWSCR